MSFEFDIKKSASNKIKHGVNFNEIQILWEDSDRIEIPALTKDEPRMLVIGKFNKKIWSCIITYRGDDIRIISARRSRKEEVAIYESKGI